MLDPTRKNNSSKKKKKKEGGSGLEAWLKCKTLTSNSGTAKNKTKKPKLIIN
jgi:hypothetical protein